MSTYVNLQQSPALDLGKDAPFLRLLPVPLIRPRLTHSLNVPILVATTNLRQESQALQAQMLVATKTKQE